MKIKNATDLRVAILELENKRIREEQQIIESYHSIKKSITPLNLVKSLFSDIKETTGLTTSILNTAAGLGVGLLTKRLFIGKSAGLVKTIIGSAVEIGTAGLVANNAGTLKSLGSRLIKNIFRSKNKADAS